MQIGQGKYCDRDFNGLLAQNGFATVKEVMPRTQHEKAVLFRALHQQPGCFLMPNAWDLSSARVFEGLGFPAIATSSSAAAATFGLSDGELNRDQALSHVRGIVAATDLPVSADLENGFGDSPEHVRETILLAASTGLVGASIEDATKDALRPLYPADFATERVAAAVRAARSLPFPFTLTARAENFIRGNPDLDDTIARLVAYENAGADVLFAPGLPSLDAVRVVCGALSKPLNFMAAIPGRSYSVAELALAGVKRISFAASFYRAAISGLLTAAREVKERGTFTYLDRSADD